MMLGKSSSVEEGKECRFWDCERMTRFTWCFEHYGAFKRDELSLCPGCGKGKWVSYAVCGRCRNGNGSGGQRSVKGSAEGSGWEPKQGVRSPAVYYVYLLAVDGMGWYAEHSEDLAERLREHRSGRVSFSAGRDVKLEWFGMVPTRDQAVELQGQLRMIGARDATELEEWVRAFSEVVGELGV